MALETGLLVTATIVMSLVFIGSTGQWNSDFKHRLFNPLDWWPRYLMRWGETTICFGKMFYQNLKGKTFYNFYKWFYGQKIFYKFNFFFFFICKQTPKNEKIYILKYYTLNIPGVKINTLCICQTLKMAKSFSSELLSGSYNSVKWTLHNEIQCSGTPSCWVGLIDHVDKGFFIFLFLVGMILYG